MKEEKEAPLLEEGEEPKLEAVEEPRAEGVEETVPEEIEEPQVEDVEEPEIQPGDDPKREPVEVPETEEVAESGSQGGDEPRAEATDEPGIEAVDASQIEDDEKPVSEGGEEEEGEDGLELDRMEVQPASEARAEEPERAEPEAVEPPATEAEKPARPSVLALLADHWMLIVAFLVGVSLVWAAFVFIVMPQEGPTEVKQGAPVHVISASLGGEHYVRFNLWGPFRDPKREAALRRGLPKVKHDLIVSGSQPEVTRSIQENDLYFLEKHILQIVSDATGIPIGELDLKGLFVTRYSDEAEVESAR